MILRISSNTGQTRDFLLHDEEDLSQLIDIVPEVDEILETNEDLDEAVRQIVMHIQNQGIDAEIIDENADDDSEEEEDSDESEPEEDESDGSDDSDADQEEPAESDEEESDEGEPEDDGSPDDDADAEFEDEGQGLEPDEESESEDEPEEESEEQPKGGQEKQLAIVDKESGEPAVILSQDENGIEVVGGDERLVEELGLGEFESLEEMADAVNSSDDSPYEAVFEGEGDEPQTTHAQQSDTMKACIDIIKDVLSRVKQRQAQEEAKQGASDPAVKAQKLMGADIIEASQEPVFFAFDGDSIGNAVARAEAKDDEAELSQMSAKINAGQDLFAQWAKTVGGTIVEQGGDEGMAKTPGTAVNQIEAFRAQYAQLVGATVTVGVGKAISQATKARMLGKLKGKNQTVIFDDTTEKELALRLKDSGQDEAQKITQAMTPGPNNPNQPKRI
jgi:hypothetical protein